LHLDFYRLSRRRSLRSHRHCMTLKTITNDQKQSLSIIGGFQPVDRLNTELLSFVVL